MISVLLIALAAVGYLAATMAYQTGMTRHSLPMFGAPRVLAVTGQPSDESARAHPWSRARQLLCAAFFIHTWAVLSCFLLTSQPASFLAGTLTLVSWMTVALYLLLWAPLSDTSSLGVFIAPTATVVLVGALATFHLASLSSFPLPQGGLLLLHVCGTVLGYAAFLLATIVAVVYSFVTGLLSKNTCWVQCVGCRRCRRWTM